jgi:hypothetical protein
MMGMRTVTVIVCLFASAQALAAPPPPPPSTTTTSSCRVSLAARKGFDVSCLPALSAKGTLVALAVIDPDGDRARPNLEVRFVPLDGRPAGSTIVLTVDELDESGQLDPAIVAKIEPRLDLVNAQLSLAGFVSLRVADKEGLEVVARGDALEIRGRRIETDSVKVATCPGPAAIAGTWLASDGKTIVAKIDRKGGDGCPAPAPIWRALHVRSAVSSPIPSPSPSPVAEASALNTRAMRKFRSKDWASASADFRAAIARDGGHVKARYNLACLASITGDRETALEQLRWLAASELPEAGQKIVKARTDPDLAFIRGDPEAQALLARGK